MFGMCQNLTLHITYSTILCLSENKKPGAEFHKLPETIDRDEFEFDGPLAPICYFIVGGNENGLFKLDRTSYILTFTTELDREKQDTHILLVKATEDCTTPPKNESFFDASDDTQIKVVVNVLDVNDNAPKFTRRVFTGGVSTATSFGTKFMSVKVIFEC